MEALRELQTGRPALPLSDTLRLTREGSHDFLKSLEEMGKSTETVKNYARSLDKLYAWLPGGKWLTAEALADWRDSMSDEGRASATVNMRISAANGYCGGGANRGDCLRGGSPLPSGLSPKGTACLRQGKAQGPLIAQRDGRPMARTQVNKQIERICRSAQVPVEKANPKCIRSLYQRTYEKVSSNITFLIHQAYENLLETEQDAIGWG